MAPPPAPKEQQKVLEAKYSSPSGEKSFQQCILKVLPDQKSPNFALDKRTYLAELRASAKTLQSELNTFLTEKMEEDKAAAPATGAHGIEQSKVNGKAADEAAEKNYGEEVVDEEDET